MDRNFVDNEHVYEYWRNHYEPGPPANIPWDNMKHLVMIPVGAALAQWLRESESGGRSHYAAACGRIYEQIFQSLYGQGTIIEGAPFDGLLNDTLTRKVGGVNRDIFPKFLFGNQVKSGTPWEMKKVRRSDDKCHFNDINVSAIAKEYGIFIGATIAEPPPGRKGDPGYNVILYRYLHILDFYAKRR